MTTYTIYRRVPPYGWTRVSRWTLAASRTDKSSLPLAIADARRVPGEIGDQVKILDDIGTTVWEMTMEKAR